MYDIGFHQRRYDYTLRFMQDNLPAPQKVLDLGTRNAFSEMMDKNGYEVSNTGMPDLDTEYKVVNDFDVDAVTAFEIFEHLLAPFNVLREIKADKLFASVPLNLWFAKAYWNDKVEWDCHYHEFEDRQFDWLLKKTGWTIIKKEKHLSPIKSLGIRPILRRFIPRHYLVYAERK